MGVRPEPATARPNRDRFEHCLGAVLKERNGYALDLNGPTNHGISEELYRLWRESNGLAAREVWRIEYRELESIYSERIWAPCHAAQCPPPLDLLVFECAIESGPVWAVRTLQQALRIRRDGIFGPKVRERLRDCDPGSVALDFLGFREEFFLDLARRAPGCAEVAEHRRTRLSRIRKALAGIAAR